MFRDINDKLRLFIIICFMELRSSLEFKFQPGKYMDSKVIEVKVNYGPTMCVRACIKYSDCFGVNYERDKLLCKLLEEPGVNNKMKVTNSLSYSGKSDWKIQNNGCWPNPCLPGQKCVVTYNDRVVCVTKSKIPKTINLEKNRDCSELSKTSTSGIYTIYPNQTDGIRVHCDMDTDGGSWTIFQKRTDASIDFYRGWEEYENGFGDVESNYWIGNANLNVLTKRNTYQLRVEVEDWDGNQGYALYSTFSIGDSASKYTLSIGNYSGTAGDSLAIHNDMKFTTKDNDNDLRSANCAVRYQGAWWYEKCASSNLNGVYQPDTKNRHSMSWETFKPARISLKSCRMMLRKLL